MLHIYDEVVLCLRTAGSTEGMGCLLWVMSPSERHRGWAIEVAVGDDTTDEHPGDDDSEISPGDGAQCQEIRCGCFAPATPPGEDDR